VRCTALLRAVVAAHAAAVQSYLLHGAAADSALEARRACVKVLRELLRAKQGTALELLHQEQQSPLSALCALTLFGDIGAADTDAALGSLLAAAASSVSIMTRRL